MWQTEHLKKATWVCWGVYKKCLIANMESSWTLSFWYTYIGYQVMSDMSFVSHVCLQINQRVWKGTIWLYSSKLAIIHFFRCPVVLTVLLILGQIYGYGMAWGHKWKVVLSLGLNLLNMRFALLSWISQFLVWFDLFSFGLAGFSFGIFKFYLKRQNLVIWRLTYIAWWKLKLCSKQQSFPTNYKNMFKLAFTLNVKRVYYICCLPNM